MASNSSSTGSKKRQSRRSSKTRSGSMSANKLYKIVMLDFIKDTSLLVPERRVLDGHATIEALAATTEDELVGKVEDADAILMWHDIHLTERGVDLIKNAKILVRIGVGFDNVPIEYARKTYDLHVANVPDYGTEEVADSTLALAMALMRGTSLLNVHLRDHPDAPWLAKELFDHLGPLHRLRGRTWGCYGLGRIGIAVALRAKAFGMHVVFYDPLIEDGRDKAIGVSRVESLEELMAASFVLSLHAPLTPHTRKVINAKRIALMQPGSFLVNTARGGIIDTDALPQAIRSGRLAGVGLDVLPQEPPSKDDVLIKAWRDPKDPCHERVIINPHSAFYSKEGYDEMRTKAAKSALAACRGDPVRTVINHHRHLEPHPHLPAEAEL